MAADELELVAAVRSKHKARSFALCPPAAVALCAGAGGHAASFVLALTNNSLELWDITEGPQQQQQEEGGSGAVGAAEKAQTLDLAGHRSDVRAPALSSDVAICLSASSNCVKVCGRGAWHSCWPGAAWHGCQLGQLGLLLPTPQQERTGAAP